MRICIINTGLSHGGASEIAMDVARGMAKSGHEVVFLCSGDHGQVYCQDGYLVKMLEIRHQNLLFHYLNPSLLRRTGQFLLDFKPDVIHVHNINLQTFSLGTLLFSHRYPMVWTLHDLWAFCLTGWPTPCDCTGIMARCRSCPTWPNPLVRINKLMKESAFRYSKFSVTVPSRWMAAMLSSSWAGKRPWEIIPNGVDEEVFIPRNGETQQLDQSITRRKKTILFCGGKRIAGQLPAHRKGWQDLVSALGILSRTRDDLHLLYAGDPLDHSSLLPVPTTFLDGVSRAQMPQVYQKADIYVLPTLADNSPLGVIEAMACKTPIVATSVGGIPEHITNAETGLLCHPQDPEGLANAIRRLLDAPEEGINLAKHAYERFIREFTLNKMVEKFLDVYVNTIANHRES